MLSGNICWHFSTLGVFDNSDMECHQQPLKLYFLPYPTPGHMIPMAHLCQIFSLHGHHVTVLTTSSNAQLLPKALSHNDVVHTFNFPSDQVGLPRGLENLSSASDGQTVIKILKAFELLRPEIQSFVEQHRPDVIVSDTMFTWASSFSQIGIPTFVFNPMPIFYSCIVDAIRRHRQVLDFNSVPFVVPGDLPHAITLNVNPLPSLDLMVHLSKHDSNYCGVIVNTFAELEGEYGEYYERISGIKVWHVGFTSLMVDSYHHDTKKLDDDIDHHHHHECLDWLEYREPCSVVYICFGSLTRLSNEQLLEIARGIEASGHSFLWVIRENFEEVESWLPQDFEERMKEEKRGIIVRGWAPQTLILKHPAIGGFLTHCGWNSVAEAIMAGVPMITMPRFADQFFNEKIVTEVHGIGVEVGGSEWSMSPYDAGKKVVKRERIEKAVRKVMEEGGGIRERAIEMQGKAVKAVKQGGSSYNNLSALIQTIQQISS